VFVSHAGDDLGWAEEVRSWLVADGHEVFLDRNLRDGLAVGEEWEQRLHERLRWADAVVCVVTAAFLRSVWCTAEVGIARSRGSRVLPVLVEAGVAHPLLPTLQHVDAVADPDGARSELLAALARVDAGGGRGWADGRSPFPGLRPFDVDQHRVFFGRAAEVEQLAARLRSPAERTAGALLVVGPSGCGKSSVVRAGLLPVIAAEPGWWTAGPVLPGRDPVGALARELAYAARRAELAWTVSDVHARLDRDGLGRVADDILVAAPGTPRRLLLVVDQFEELLTQASAAERARFVALLGPAMLGSVRVVATLRSEFLDPLLIDPASADLPQHTHVLQPLRRDALRTVVEGPARLAGIGVDDDLVARLVDDTGGGDALPLLAFTLAELAVGVERGGRLLARRYEQLGGVQGALARHADAALADAVRAGGRRPDEVVTQLLRLVTVDEQGRPTRWRTRRAELSDTAVTELDAFVARRLLTSDSNGDGVVVSVAHEAFLSAWPPLASAIAEASTALRARRGVEQAADAWADSGRPADRLWDGGHLAAALADTGAREERGTRARIVTGRVELTERAQEFLHRSIRRDRRRRRRAISILSVLLVVALVGALVAVIGQRAANEQRGVANEQREAASEQQRIATARQLVAQSETVRNTDQGLALRLALAARKINDNPETRSNLAAAVTGSRAAIPLLDGNFDSPRNVAVAPKRKLLAGGGQGVRLREFTESGAPIDHGLLLNRGDGNDGLDAIDALAFTPDEQHIVTVGFAPNPADPTDPLGFRALTVWDISAPAAPRRLAEPMLIAPTGAGSVSLAIVGDGRTLALAESASVVELWDIRNPAEPRRHPTTIQVETLTDSAQRGVEWLASPLGSSMLAVVGADGWVGFWDVANPELPVRLGEIPGGNEVATDVSTAFADDGRTLALGRRGMPVTLWDLTDPHQPRRTDGGIRGSTGLVAFAPDGNTLATADDSVLLWDVITPGQPREVGRFLNGEMPQALGFAPDGMGIIAAYQETTAIWTLAGPGHPGMVVEWKDDLPGVAEVEAVAVAPDGRTVATAIGDFAKVRAVGTPPRPASTVPASLPAAFVDEHTLALASPDPAAPFVQLWDVTDVADARPTGPRFPHPGRDWVQSVALDPTGRVLVTGGMEHDVRLWEVTFEPGDPAPRRELGDPLQLDGPIIRALAFSPDGRLLVTADGQFVVLWSLADPHRPKRLGSVEATVSERSAMGFADEGRTLLLAGADTTLSVWDVTDPTRPKETGGPPPDGGHERVALVPGDDLLATADGAGGAVLWDLTDRTRPRQLGSVLQAGDTVAALAFSADGRTLATATDTGTTRVWDLNALHDVRRDAAQHACAIAGGLTPDEWARYVSGLTYIDACAP
jgi:WD40 repeat protein